MRKIEYVWVLLLLMIVLAISTLNVGAIFTSNNSYINNNTPFSTATPVPTATLVPGVTMDDAGVCKFFEVKTGFVGGTIEASGLGVPSVMRLKVDGKIFVLPVIESSIVRDAVTGKWTAQFATIDSGTGQPLVPDGEFEVGCFGANGTADGSGTKVTITR